MAGGAQRSGQLVLHDPERGNPARVASRRVLGKLILTFAPESKVAKNRVHLNIHIHVDPDQKVTEVKRLVGLGARLIETHSDRGPMADAMRDPEGNEFCLH